MSDIKLVALLSDKIGDRIFKANDKTSKDLEYRLNNLGNVEMLKLSYMNSIDLNAIISVLKKFNDLQILILNSSKIVNIDKIKELPKLIVLNLSTCNVKDISFLEHLLNLKNLQIRGNKITNIESISYLKELEYLDISANPITDFSSLENLNLIEELVLNDLQITDIAFLKKHKNLIRLEVDRNSINDLTPLSNLKKLEALQILSNKIIDLSPLKKILSLRSLNLGFNNIINISPIKNLINLRTLWLVGNNKVDITAIADFPSLTKLSLGECEITNISGISFLKKLTRLDLQGNKIKNISELKDLTNLEELNLSNNHLDDIKALKDLKKLNCLQLQKNPIKYLPTWIVDFKMKIVWKEFGWSQNTISFYDNPFISPSVSIIKQGKASINRYFKRIEKEGLDYIYEAKLTLVGEGGSGKTSLQVRLLDPKGILPKEDNRTRGIKIIDWIFKTLKGKNHIAHIWDFGGQDVYYPVHRFFLTEDSVFVLLASTRQTSHNFDYWIPTIYQFGANSPIILGQTCHDGNKVPWNDLNYYIGNSNFNIIKTQVSPYTELNLTKANEGLAKIKKEILFQIEKLPHYGKGVPKSWVSAREAISKQSKKAACISFQKFKEICENVNPIAFKKIVDVEDCAKFLHSIGVVLWYSEIVDLKDWVILQPEWAMNAVYKIIDDEEIQKANRRGNIFATDFSRLWKAPSYVGKENILKNMLQVFKIAFPKKHKKSDYIIPARLISMPDEKRWTMDEPFVRIEYKFDFMPRGITNQLTAELSRYIYQDYEVWNNAVNLINETKNATCQIEEDFYNRKITVKARGKGSRDFISIIKHALKDITEEYKGVQPEIIVPCTCSQCFVSNKPTRFYYNDLLRWSEVEENSTVYCNEGRETLLIEKLLYNVGLPKESRIKDSNIIGKPKKPIKLFVSYSKFDEEYLQDFQDHLVTLKEEGLLSFDCREIGFGKQWDAEIKSKIDDCNIMVCLVSVKFLNTDYIKKIEIAKAIAENKIIIPIIIKPCDWESSILGKYQAAQRGKVVSLDNNEKLVGKIKSYNEVERAAFWTSIIKEFRKKILSY